MGTTRIHLGDRPESAQRLGDLRGAKGWVPTLGSTRSEGGGPSGGRLLELAEALLGGGGVAGGRSEGGVTGRAGDAVAEAGHLGDAGGVALDVGDEGAPG